jgi:hypothetical protein
MQVIFGGGDEKIKKNSVVWVSERTMPADRRPLVGEISADFYG